MRWAHTVTSKQNKLPGATGWGKGFVERPLTFNPGSQKQNLYPPLARHQFNPLPWTPLAFSSWTGLHGTCVKNNPPWYFPHTIRLMWDTKPWPEQARFVKFRQIHMGLITLRSSMPVAKPGETLVPCSKGKGISFGTPTKTRTPASWPRELTYSSCSMFISKVRPEKNHDQLYLLKLLSYKNINLFWLAHDLFRITHGVLIPEKRMFDSWTYRRFGPMREILLQIIN